MKSLLKVDGSRQKEQAGEWTTLLQTQMRDAQAEQR